MGRGGADRIDGGNGDDVLRGGADEGDQLLGSKGADFLGGGDGDDLCEGGKGKDRSNGLCVILVNVP